MIVERVRFSGEMGVPGESISGPRVVTWSAHSGMRGVGAAVGEGVFSRMARREAGSTALEVRSGFRRIEQDVTRTRTARRLRVSPLDVNAEPPERGREGKEQGRAPTE